MPNRISQEGRRRIMQAIQGRNTAPERQVRSFIHRAGLRFRLHRRDLPGVPDIVLTSCRAVIFVHGCFWHQHNRCENAAMPRTNTEYWRTKFRRNRDRDKRHREQLVRDGWRVIVIWECQTNRTRLARLVDRLDRIKSGRMLLGPSRRLDQFGS